MRVRRYRARRVVHAAQSMGRWWQHSAWPPCILHGRPAWTSISALVPSYRRVPGLWPRHALLLRVSMQFPWRHGASRHGLWRPSRSPHLGAPTQCHTTPTTPATPHAPTPCSCASSNSKAAWLGGIFSALTCLVFSVLGAKGVSGLLVLAAAAGMLGGGAGPHMARWPFGGRGGRGRPTDSTHRRSSVPAPNLPLRPGAGPVSPAGQ